MFTVQDFDVDEFESSWKNEKDSRSESVQTTKFSTKDQQTNTAKSVSIQTQTESVKENNISESVDMQKLAKWLKSVCPDMINELNDTTLSNAMSSVRLEADSAELTAKMLQKITVCNYGATENFYVSSLSWNCTGNTLAVSCCFAHETWCYHQGVVSLFTFDRNNSLPSSATKKLICNTCVTTVCFHPTQPSILCAGTISGEIFLWNNQSDEGDGLIASVSAHDDRISLMSWVVNVDPKKHSVVLATSGIDCYLILWDVDVEDSLVKVRQKYTVGKSTKVVSSPDVLPKKSERGITHFDFSPHVSGLFVLGMEGGTIVKCSLLGAKPFPTGDSTVLDPTISYFERHEGEISSIQFSPQRKELFLSCGTDNEIRIFHIEQSTPVQIIFMDVTLNMVSWIVHEQKLLVGSGENGCIRLFSLLNGQLIPNSASHDAEPLTKLAINKKRTDIAAFGNQKGEVLLWSIPWNNIALQDSHNVYGK